MAGFSNSRAATVATNAGLGGTLYASLHSADPAGTGANELSSAGGYARQAVTFTETSRTWANDAIETFTATGADFSATATHICFWTAVSGGTVELEGPLAMSKTIADGETGTVAAGAFTVVL